MLDASFNVFNLQDELSGTIKLDNSSLGLAEGGSLVGLAAIEVGVDSRLGFSDRGNTNDDAPDRIDDATTIISAGGRITLRALPGVVATETLGTLQLRSGGTSVPINDEDTPSSVLTLGGFERSPGAFVQFDVREGDVVFDSTD